jgi:dCTP deaminase
VILTAAQVCKEVEAGTIEIDPFDVSRLNPNSYNLRLGPKLLQYAGTTLDCKANNPTFPVDIPEEGFIVMPGQFYLGATVERTATEHFVPMLDGRSSLARLGLSVHQTGGFGDIGFGGTWTLEITAAVPVRIYAGIEICQVQFWRVYGDVTTLYKGKYLDQKDPQPSKLYKEMTHD